MTKIRIGFGLLAVLGLCAFAVSPAFAESEWLVAGAAAVNRPAETEGLLVLRKFAGAGSVGVLTEIECLGIFDGELNGKTSTISDVSSLTMITTGTLVDTNKTALSCEVTRDESGLTDCKAATLPSLWLVGINLELGEFVTATILLNGTAFSLDLGGLNNLGIASGYDIECESLIGISGSEECVGEANDKTNATAALTNVTTTTPPSVLGVFLAAAVAERASCTMTGPESADIIGEGNTWAVGGTVAAPEELNRLETAVS